jgi:signal peptidase I
MRNFFKRNKTDESFGEKKEKSALIDFLQSVTIAIILSFIIFSIITPSEVDGPSMEPTFYNGERVYTDRLPQWFSTTDIGRQIGLSYNRGDVIVFFKPTLGSSLIKRVIGLPGDRIKFEDGKVYVNGQLLVENYLADNTYTKPGNFKEGQEFKVQLEETDINGNKVIDQDVFFVMGDNRGVSNDSRYVGFIKREWMQGKVVFRLWPLNRFGVVQTGSFSLNDVPKN